MHSASDPGAIADPIETVPDAWDEATLMQLRSTALDIGRLLRAAAAAAERDEAEGVDGSPRHDCQSSCQSSSGLSSVRCSTTVPSMASISTSDRLRGGFSAE